MDEAEQDMRINQTKVSVICQSEAEADNVDRGLNNSDILRKLNSIIFLLFILQKNSHAGMRLGIEANKKLKVKVIFSPEKTKKVLPYFCTFLSVL